MTLIGDPQIHLKNKSGKATQRDRDMKEIRRMNRQCANTLVVRQATAYERRKYNIKAGKS